MFDPIKIERKQTFTPSRVYHADGYKLEFINYWILSYNNTFVMSDSEKNFLEIVRSLELLPYKANDTLGEDSTYFEESAENISSWRAAFPDNQEIIQEELKAYGLIDQSFSVYEAGQKRQILQEEPC